MSVLVLQAFTGQRGPAAGSAHQKAFAARIGKCPDQVSNALKAEHGVIREERDHWHAIIGVRRAGRGHGSHRAGFGDSFLQNLPVFCFAIIEQHVDVVRLIELALAGVNANLPDDRFHAERAGFVRNNRHHQLADFRVLHQVAQHADEAHGRRDGAAFRSFQRFLESFQSAGLRIRAHPGGRRAWACNRPALCAAPACIEFPGCLPADDKARLPALPCLGWEFQSASGKP